VNLVSRFTDQGLIGFREFLQDARTNPGAVLTRVALRGADAAAPIDGQVEFVPITGVQRLHAAQYVDGILNRSGRRAALEVDVAFWAWLVAANFDALCPKDPKTRCYRVGNDWSYWIPEPRNYRRRHRHRLSGPYFAYRAHLSDIPNAMGVLGSKLSGYDDLIERVLSTEEFSTSRAVNHVVTSLYYSPATKDIKRGVGGSGRGSSRRLADVLSQFALTYDLGALTGPQLLAMLPAEFDRFRS
jgi:hypothetical protein